MAIGKPIENSKSGVVSKESVGGVKTKPPLIALTTITYRCSMNRTMQGWIVAVVKPQRFNRNTNAGNQDKSVK